MRVKTISFLILLLPILEFNNYAYAQQNNEVDIVYLKNGSVIKGKIVEIIPDKRLKIETLGGSVFVYKMSEVSKIEKGKKVGKKDSSETSTVNTQLNLEYKKKSTAMIWSFFITGAGHIYADEPGKGILLLITRAATPFAFQALYCAQEYKCTPSSAPTTDFTGLYVGLGVSTAIWIYGIIDSGNAVEDYNEKIRNKHSLSIRPINIKNEAYPTLSYKIRF